MNKSKILVVDDDPKLSRLVKAILEKTNLFEVQEENRSSAAFATAKAFGPDMILLDVDMPGKDGGDVAHELEADPILSRKPVLFFTSLISKAEAGQHEVERGGKLFLAKPVDPQVLVRTVGRILGQQPAGTGFST
jgi:CheY-like chemotaxis protein